MLLQNIIMHSLVFDVDDSTLTELQTDGASRQAMHFKKNAPILLF